MSVQTDPTEQSTNYIDKGLEALRKLRDVLTPHGIHITQVRELTNTVGDRSVVVDLTVHVPVESTSDVSSDSSRATNR
jgi:hypothetical protein